MDSFLPFAPLISMKRASAWHASFPNYGIYYYLFLGISRGAPFFSLLLDERHIVGAVGGYTLSDDLEWSLRLPTSYLALPSFSWSRKADHTFIPFVRWPSRHGQKTETSLDGGCRTIRSCLWMSEINWSIFRVGV